MSLWRYLRDLLKAVQAIEASAARAAAAADRAALAAEQIAALLTPEPAVRLEIVATPPTEQGDLP